MTVPVFRNPRDVADWLATNPTYLERCDAQDALYAQMGDRAFQIYQDGKRLAGHTTISEAGLP